MKTEQELYYERKNREAEQLNQTLGLLVPGIIIGLLVWWAWPVVLFFAVLYAIWYILKKAYEISEKILAPVDRFFDKMTSKLPWNKNRDEKLYARQYLRLHQTHNMKMYRPNRQR